MAGFIEGELILLTSQKGRKWLVRVADNNFSCHLGTVNLLAAVGHEEGDHILTAKGMKLFMTRPRLVDYMLKVKRQTQIVYPKDTAAIITYGDIAPGMTMLETGIGSGALCLGLLRALGEKGRLISVEKRLEFAELAVRNLTYYHGERPANHHLINADITDFVLPFQVDRVMLDLPEPWIGVGPVAPMLKRGGILVSLSPNVGQVQLTWKELKRNGFEDINVFETLRRNWLVDELRARPTDRMIGHTGFITVAKKVRIPVPATEHDEM